ncbi:AtpZ/AtpI family protein [Flavobacterium terrigena]|uniref:Putative F0F1-ATPase subunit Ca2+/Mg2+ transporter n=1 Tax=Flavobacterium terrigena TaxID=402734 RepID=A0A1H6SRJ4_9FLAO|nr:AtpZ/AtpI family protein [Flavobacterium terrigena]SEI70493.1 Putative F0F1-ATPase subunit Ca2+/Mg2+ transporter [Flavobacterium terrigena]
MPIPKKANKWLQLISIPAQMGIVIFLFAYLGQYLDEKYESENYVKIFTVVGVFLAMYNVIRQVNQLNKDDK